MSELRWNWAYYPYLDAPNEQEESALKAGYIKVVDKSEADKVIEEKNEKIDELEERIDELQKATDSAWSKVNAMYDELRHQKYKRCVAMAKLCHERSLWWYSNGYGFEKYDKFCEKWEKRWLELAEKFKEAK